MKNFLKSTTFLAIFASWLWSTAFVGVKIGLEFHTPLQFAGIRFFAAGVLIFIFWGKPRRYFTELKTHARFILLLSVVQIFLQYALFYTGLNMVPGALAAMIVGSSPLFVAIVAHFSMTDDRLTPLKTGSILIGVAGIAIITIGRTKVEFRGELELLGVGLLMLNNIAAGFSNVLISKYSRGISPVVLSSTSLIVGGIMLFVVSIPTEGIKFGPFPVDYYLALTWLSLLSASAITVWFALLKRPGVKVSVLNVWKFLIPVSGAILSWIILANESPDLPSIAGMAIIAVALLVLNYSNRKGK